MQKYSKKIISVVVLLSFLLSLFPMTAFANIKSEVDERNEAVNAEEVESIQLTPNILQYLEIGTTKQYDVKIFPENISPEQAGLTWSSSDTRVGTIDNNGNFTAKAKGRTEIEVRTSNGKVAEAVINVWPAGYPTQVHFTNPNNYPLFAPYHDSSEFHAYRQSATVTVGNTFKVGAQVYPEDTKDKSYTYSSMNNSIATVDSSGNVRGIAVGSTQIRVTCNANGIYSDLYVNVQASAPTTSLKIIGKNNPCTKDNGFETVGIGKTLNLKVYTYPDYRLVSNSDVTWKNSGEDAHPVFWTTTINSNGVLTGLAKSISYDTITATLKSNTSINGRENVICVDDSTFSVSNTDIVLDPIFKASETIDLYFKRADPNQQMPTIGPNIDTSLVSFYYDWYGDIDIDGHATLTISASGRGNGKTVIPITYGNKTINVNVSVINRYKFDTAKLVDVKTEFQLNDEFYAQGRIELSENGGPTGMSIALSTWNNGNIARDVELSNFDTSSVGEKRAKLSYMYSSIANNNWAYIEVFYPYTVVESAESIEIMEKDKTSLEVGESAQYTAILKPDEYFDKTVTWTSSDPTVATITEDGLVTAVSPGTTTITVTAASGVQDSIVITVEGNIEGITLEGLKDVYELNETFAEQGNVIITYKDGSTNTVPLTADMVSDFDTSSVGDKVAHVTYQGFTVEYNYTVIDSNQGGDSGDAMTEILTEKGIQSLMGEAIDKYFNKEGILPKTGGLDSTGPNFGQDIKSAVTAMLGIETGNFDFRIYRTGTSNSYKVYIFDLSGKDAGDTVEVTGFQYNNGNVSEPTEVQDITVISKTTEDVDGNSVGHLTINAEEFVW